MKTSTAFGLVAAISLVGAGAFLYSPKAGAPQAVVAADTAASPDALPPPGAPLADVRLPADLSAGAATGKTYYTAVCASCHGANAAGQDGVAPPLVHPLYVASHHGDAAFVAAARNGARQHHWSFGSMPPLEQRLTDGELNAIILYIRELQRENGIL